jgi:hypothetical protein
MDAGGISVVRLLPIDPAIASGALLALRRDTPGSATGWSLGRRGSAEVDVDFFRTGAPNPTWTATARLWDPQAIAVVRAVVDLTVIEPDSCELSMRPILPLSPWWSARMPALLDLARAALDELAEELLWHASREAEPSHDVP